MQTMFSTENILFLQEIIQSTIKLKWDMKEYNCYFKMEYEELKTALMDKELNDSVDHSHTHAKKLNPNIQELYHHQQP